MAKKQDIPRFESTGRPRMVSRRPDEAPGPHPAKRDVSGDWRYPARAGPSMGPVCPGRVRLGRAPARGGPMPGSSPYRVVVIGAGFGGIGMGIALRRAGIEDFLIVDKGDGPGG